MRMTRYWQEKTLIIEFSIILRIWLSRDGWLLSLPTWSIRRGRRKTGDFLQINGNLNQQRSTLQTCLQQLAFNYDVSSERRGRAKWHAEIVPAINHENDNIASLVSACEAGAAQ